jgi:hypothetical protein
VRQGSDSVGRDIGRGCKASAAYTSALCHAHVSQRSVARWDPSWNCSRNPRGLCKVLASVLEVPVLINDGVRLE